MPIWGKWVEISTFLRANYHRRVFVLDWRKYIRCNQIPRRIGNTLPTTFCFLVLMNYCHCIPRLACLIFGVAEPYWGVLLSIFTLLATRERRLRIRDLHI
jgi:hypothetical protein